MDSIFFWNFWNSFHGDLRKTRIFNQYKLNEESEFSGQIPDLMFAFNDYAMEKKYFLFVEFYKWYKFYILFTYFTYNKGIGTQHQQQRNIKPKQKSFQRNL